MSTMNRRAALARAVALTPAAFLASAATSAATASAPDRPLSFLLPSLTSDADLHPDLGPTAYSRVTVLTADQLAAIPEADRPEHIQYLGDLVITSELVPRWEVPAVVAGPQPIPERLEVDEGRLVRTWRPGDQRRCRLCARCSFETPDNLTCTVDVDDLPDGMYGIYEDPAADPDVTALALYSERHAGPLPLAELA